MFSETCSKYQASIVLVVWDRDRYILVMSGIAGIDTGIDTLVSKEVLIPKIGISMRYRKVSIPELGIEIRY